MSIDVVVILVVLAGVIIVALAFLGRFLYSLGKDNSTAKCLEVLHTMRSEYDTLSPEADVLHKAFMRVDQTL